MKMLLVRSLQLDIKSAKTERSNSFARRAQLRHIYYSNGWPSQPHEQCRRRNTQRRGARNLHGWNRQSTTDRQRRRVRPGISVCGCGGNGGGVWKRPAFHWYSQQESIWLTGFCFDIHGINRNFKQNGNFIWIFWLSGRFYWPATFANVLIMVRNCHGYTINLNTLKFNSLICENLRTYLLLLLMIMSYFSFLELSWVSRR